MNKKSAADNILSAARRIKPFVKNTPVFTCETINKLCSAEIYFKAENMQKVGAFKARGAINAVFSINDENCASGVITHSSGNHGAALAYAARCRGIAAYIVVPESAPPVKKAAVAGYGGRITFCEPTQIAREKTVEEIREITGATLIHPYNDYDVIFGQATAALELIRQVPDLEILIAPVGGGGLLSGTCLSASCFKKEIAVYGAEPKHADDAYRSLQKGSIVTLDNPDTIADGLRTSLGSITFPIIYNHIRDIVTVGEEDIITSMRLIWERMKLVVEPSAAVPVAALTAGGSNFAGKKIGLILSGGNVDLEKLPWQ